MAIKLKIMTKRNKGITLYIAWAIISMTIYIIGKSRFWLKAQWLWVFTAAIIVGTIATGIYTYRFLKEYTIEDLHKNKIDYIPVELVGGGAVIAALGLFIYSVNTYYQPYYMAYYVGFKQYDAITILATWIGMVMVWGIIYGGIILLIRRKILHTFKETSLIYKEIERYRNRTSVEKRMEARQKRWLVTMVILAIALMISLVLAGAYYETIYLVVSGALLIGLVVVMMLCFFRGTYHRDLSLLLKQIEQIYQGKNQGMESPLKDSSVFYEASSQLSQIESTMEHSIEKQVQAERMKVELVTNVSHDLKTPLTSMVGYTDLLKKEELSPEAQDYVEVIALKQDQLKDMIQDLFELAKSTSNSEPLEIETLNMKKLVEQILADMGDSIDKSGLDFRKTFVGNALFFKGDNRKMYRVVQNLVGNALKYALEGTRVYINAYQKDDKVYMEIKNTSAYEMNFTAEEITERFCRGDKSRSTEGHGLGLAIASSFTQNMGGNMEVVIDGDLFKVVLEFQESN